LDSKNTAWSRTTKYIVGVSLVLFGIYLIYLSRDVIPALVVAVLIAMITHPAIGWLHERTHMARGLALAIVYLAVLILIPLLLLLAVPAIINAVNYALNVDYAAFARSALAWLRSVLVSIRDFQIPIASLDAYVDQMVNDLLASLQTPSSGAALETPSLSTILRSLGTALTTTFSTVTNVVGAVASKVVLLIYILLASIYMNLSAHAIREDFLQAIPSAYRREINLLMDQIGQVWSAFFRGELTLMLVIGVMSWLGLTALGIPAAPYLGFIAGLLELIPNIGPVLSAVPAVIVALVQGSSYLPLDHLAVAALVIILYILIQQFENNLIVPRVLGDALELPPLVVMTGVLVGATAGGILGALLATPMIATAREILRYVYRKILGVDPYPPGEETVEKKPALDPRLVHLFNQIRQRLPRFQEPARQEDGPSKVEPVPEASGEQEGNDSQD